MSTLAASNLEPPPKINQPPSPWLSLFSSLPNDIVLDILARVPKRYYPILSCVSKNLQFLVHSPEIYKTRSLYCKDSLYICFNDIYAGTSNWFPEKNPTENLLVSIDFPFLPKNYYSSIIAVGSEIFFILDSQKCPLWIFDSRSGKSRQGPNMRVKLHSRSVGLVGNKIYVIGFDRRRKLRAEFYDLKTQTWKPAPVPKGKEPIHIWSVPPNVTLDRKVCWLNNGFMTCYDTINGSCESYEFANDEKWGFEVVCVIDNVMYAYRYKFGLMWYDSKLRQWRMVNGLDHLNMIRPVGMMEYYGKLAYVWTKPEDFVVGETKEIWCRMIALEKRDQVGMHAAAEPSQLVRTVPRGCSVKCFSLSG